MISTNQLSEALIILQRYCQQMPAHPDLEVSYNELHETARKLNVTTSEAAFLAVVVLGQSLARDNTNFNNGLQNILKRQAGRFE